MMQIHKYPDRESWTKLVQRPGAADSEKLRLVKEILEQVKSKGDKALFELTKKLDKVSLTSLKADQRTIANAGNKISPELKKAIARAYTNIFRFHNARLKGKPEKIETIPGVLCWRKPVAIENIGIYIPGGSAPLFSTVLMLGIPARIAGCRNIILCSPPPVHPAILYSAALCGIKNIFGIGGAQAIGAMAYGTDTVPGVDKIFGPGNSFVTAAKQLVNQTGTAIDMPAGPSELLVIADGSSNASYVAADLLSQAEHGPDSQVMLLSDNHTLVNDVLREIDSQLEKLPKKKTAREALGKSRALVFKNLSDCMDFSNFYAPEHLIICCRNAPALAGKVVNAGSVFIGNYSPESAGDYASGTNHTLPTSGFARTYSGVSVDSFVKHITFQKISRTGLLNLADTIVTMAEAEQLTAHGNAVRIRIKND